MPASIRTRTEKSTPPTDRLPYLLLLPPPPFEPPILSQLSDLPCHSPVPFLRPVLYLLQAVQHLRLPLPPVVSLEYGRPVGWGAFRIRDKMSRLALSVQQSLVAPFSSSAVHLSSRPTPRVRSALLPGPNNKTLSMKRTNKVRVAGSKHAVLTEARSPSQKKPRTRKPWSKNAFGHACNSEPNKNPSTHTHTHVIPRQARNTLQIGHPPLFAPPPAPAWRAPPLLPPARTPSPPPC